VRIGIDATENAAQAETPPKAAGPGHGRGLHGHWKILPRPLSHQPTDPFDVVLARLPFMLRVTHSFVEKSLGVNQSLFPVGGRVNANLL
jgi:hypothetical protein